MFLPTLCETYSVIFANSSIVFKSILTIRGTDRHRFFIRFADRHEGAEIPVAI